MVLHSESKSLFDRVVQVLAYVMVSISGITLCLIMLISTADVALRYFFLAPINGASEIVSMLMVIAATFGFGYCELRNGHIRITVATERLPQKQQHYFNMFTYVVCIITTGLLTWRAILRFWDYLFRTRDHLTDLLSIPYWPFILMMTVGLGWLFIIFIIKLVKAFRGEHSYGTN